MQEKDRALDLAHQTMTETRITESALRGDMHLAENSVSEHASVLHSPACLVTSMCSTPAIGSLAAFCQIDDADRW